MPDPVIPNPCACGHDLGDHWEPFLVHGTWPCDIDGCRCEDFEADGAGWEPDDDYDRTVEA